ncbi:MAG: hypothetical protein ABIL58_15490 [Pseudomonadota bacterium]
MAIQDSGRCDDDSIVGRECNHDGAFSENHRRHRLDAAWEDSGLGDKRCRIRDALILGGIRLSDRSRPAGAALKTGPIRQRL